MLMILQTSWHQLKSQAADADDALRVCDTGNSAQQLMLVMLGVFAAAPKNERADADDAGCVCQAEQLMLIALGALAAGAISRTADADDAWWVRCVGQEQNR